MFCLSPSLAQSRAAIDSAGQAGAAIRLQRIARPGCCSRVRTKAPGREAHNALWCVVGGCIAGIKRGLGRLAEVRVKGGARWASLLSVPASRGREVITRLSHRRPHA